jgi:hypothetical protein
MGKIFKLDQDVRAVVQTVFDDMICEFGKDCRIVYPPRWIACANCIFDQQKALSSNRWKTGGPMPFPSGATCPLCNGKGRAAEEVSEVLHLLCSWQEKRFAKTVPNLTEVRLPYGLLSTKGYLVDMPKLQRCDHLIVQIPIEAYGVGQYHLIGEPGDRNNIIQGRYCVALWERFG